MGVCADITSTYHKNFVLNEVSDVFSKAYPEAFTETFLKNFVKVSSNSLLRSFSKAFTETFPKYCLRYSLMYSPKRLRRQWPQSTAQNISWSIPLSVLIGVHQVIPSSPFYVLYSLIRTLRITITISSYCSLPYNKKWFLFFSMFPSIIDNVWSCVSCRLIIFGSFSRPSNVLKTGFIVVAFQWIWKTFPSSCFAEHLLTTT